MEEFWHLIALEQVVKAEIRQVLTNGRILALDCTGAGSQSRDSSSN